MKMPQWNYIFISYSRDDEPRVTPIVEEMRNSGYNIWYDGDIQPGEDWTDNIASRIANCTVCVAFHSKKSRDSPHCREEIHYALKHGKTVISVYLEDVTLESGLDMQLARFQSVRCVEPIEPTDPIESAELLKVLRRNPDFERCGPDAPKKWKNININEIGIALKNIVQLLVNAVSSLLVAIFSLHKHYVEKTPIYHFDDKSDVLDIINPPFLNVNVEMTDYNYCTNSIHNPFNPPPWAVKTPLVECVVIRKGVTHIGDLAFKDCFNMRFVFIPESMASIGREAFSGCTGLQSVYFPSSVTTIWSNAFSGCIGLQEMTIPNSVRFIDDCAFSGCIRLKTIYIQSTPERVQRVENRDSITDPDTLYICANAFDPGTKIIFEPPDAGADVVEYIWGSD